LVLDNLVGGNISSLYEDLFPIDRIDAMGVSLGENDE
jgi:hypothetical protein